MRLNPTTSDLESHFDKTLTLSQTGKEIEYGIIDGDNTIVFIKAGLNGSCYGYENKYVRIGRALKKRYGCSVISSSNPLGYETDFAAEMDFVRNYAQNRCFDSYQVYFFGHSNGAALGIINAWQFAEIKKLVCVNAPLMINPHLLLRGIKDFSGEKMTLVYGSKDASFNMLKLYSELESDRIGFVCIAGFVFNLFCAECEIPLCHYYLKLGDYCGFERGASRGKADGTLPDGSSIEHERRAF